MSSNNNKLSEEDKEFIKAVARFYAVVPEEHRHGILTTIAKKFGVSKQRIFTMVQEYKQEMKKEKDVLQCVCRNGHTWRVYGQEKIFCPVCYEPAIKTTRSKRLLDKFIKNLEI